MSDIVQIWYPKQRVSVLESSLEGGWFEIWVPLRLKKNTRKNPDPDQHFQIKRMCVGKFVTEWMLEWGDKYSFVKLYLLGLFTQIQIEHYPFFYSRPFFWIAKKIDQRI